MIEQPHPAPYSVAARICLGVAILSAALLVFLMPVAFAP